VSEGVRRFDGVLASIAGVLFPVACPGCGQPCRPAPVCADCLAEVAPPPPVPPPAGVDRWAAPFAYEGAVRELIARVKYRDERHALDWLAAQAAATARAALACPDAITWAPTTSARRRARGFDHAAALARRVARELDVPCRSLLVRIDADAQTGRPARERRSGPRFALARGAPASLRAQAPARVLVVDDVTTTGATLRAAAVVLGAPGRTVDALTVARTPPPR
jgi:predicted amidophosphoribosyltransferase